MIRSLCQFLHGGVRPFVTAYAWPSVGGEVEACACRLVACISREDLDGWRLVSLDALLGPRLSSSRSVKVPLHEDLAAASPETTWIAKHRGGWVYFPAPVDSRVWVDRPLCCSFPQQEDCIGAMADSAHLLVLQLSKGYLMVRFYWLLRGSVEKWRRAVCA